MRTSRQAPKGRSRGYRKREKTRNQLISAGLRILAEKGEALTVSDVVAAADVSNGTFYNYFVDRDELFDALAQQLVATLAAETAAETPADDAALRLATATGRVMARAAADPTWGRVVMRLETMRAEVQEEAVRYLREDLALGLAQGRFEVGPDDAAMDLVAGMLLMSIRRIVAGRAEAGYLQEALARVLRALGVPADEVDDIAKRALAPRAPQCFEAASMPCRRMSS
jgi:AcrR family transcriptional regulator